MNAAWLEGQFGERTMARCAHHVKEISAAIHIYTALALMERREQVFYGTRRFPDRHASVKMLWFHLQCRRSEDAEARYGLSGDERHVNRMNRAICATNESTAAYR